VRDRIIAVPATALGRRVRFEVWHSVPLKVRLEGILTWNRGDVGGSDVREKPGQGRAPNWRCG
jgi:hypothetical protein